MSEVTRHDPGRFSWVELATSDTAAAKTFYAGLFGWTAEDKPAGPDMIYTTLRLRGLDVGALYAQEKAEAAQGVPPHWNLYVAVESADAAAAKAKELGGKVLLEPFDVMEHGRMSVIQDPTGAALCVWQPRQHIGLKVVNEPGAFCWGEVYTADTQEAGRFYTQLFGWTLKESPDYTEFHLGGEGVGGMMALKPEWGPMPAHWVPYFQVEDCDATAQKARSLGAKVKDPQDIPDAGRFAMIADPTGAHSAVIRLNPRG